MRTTGPENGSRKESTMSGRKRYRVSVTEKNYGSVTVEADTLEEAYELVEEEYANGDVYWGKTDFQIGNMEEVKE